MKCGWYEERVELGDVELWRNERPAAALIEHARSCAVCDQLVAAELELKLKFRELADTSRDAEPSASVKSALLAELAVGQPQRRAWVPRLAFALAAVTVLIVGIVWLRYMVQPQRNNLAAAPEQVVPQRPVVAESAAQPAKPQERIKNVHRRMKTIPALSAKSADKAGAPTANANDFYPVMMCDSLSCAGPTVAIRVEMPVSPLSGSNRKVLADLLVGEDGQVRGVRVLQ